VAFDQKRDLVWINQSTLSVVVLLYKLSSYTFFYLDLKFFDSSIINYSYQILRLILPC